MAISSSNSGGAWDNAKKYIEAKNLIVAHDENVELSKIKDKQGKNDDERKLMESYTPNLNHYAKGSEPHKSAVVGDTVGDPLKDTSGPSLNILVKLSAITSLVFGTFFSDNALYKL